MDVSSYHHGCVEMEAMEGGKIEYLDGETRTKPTNGGLPLRKFHFGKFHYCTGNDGGKICLPHAASTVLVLVIPIHSRALQGVEL